MNANPNLKLVHDFWDEATCGETLYLEDTSAAGYAAHSAERYRLEPYIPSFANWSAMKGKDVLEIGAGLGSDLEQFARAGAVVTGIDLTPRAIAHCRERFSQSGLKAQLLVANAESLPFADASFDHVYSWGVLHHSPNTELAVSEAMRVLKPGGTFAIMVYYMWSLVGAMLWARYGLLRGKPFQSLRTIYSEHLESPGTRAFTMPEARALMNPYSSELRIWSQLTHGDLLESDAGQRHRGRALDAARRFWPRRTLSKLAKNHGLFLMISGRRK